MTNTPYCELCKEREAVTERQLLGKFGGEECVGTFILCADCVQTMSDEATIEDADPDNSQNQFDDLPDWVTTQHDAIIHLRTQVENLEEYKEEQEKKETILQTRQQSDPNAKMNAMAEGRIYNYEGFRPEEAATAAGIAAFSATAFVASIVATILTVRYPNISIVPIAMGGISVAIAASSYTYYHVTQKSQQ